MFVDLGVSKLLSATKAQRKIAIEIKSFVSRSVINDLEAAVGQFIVYHDVLVQNLPDTELYLAIGVAIYNRVFQEPIGQLLLANKRLQLLVIDMEMEVVLRWIPDLVIDKS